MLKLKAQAVHDCRPSSLNTPSIELTVYCYSITAGNIEILPGKAKANVCSGDNVTFEAGILSSLDILNIYWFQMPPEGVLHLSKNDEHFTMFTNLTYSSLHIRNTLPSLSSDYLLSVQDPNSDLWDNVVFNLKAQDVYLDALVESPIEISLGDDTILKVNKSLKGSLLWTHNGQMVQGMEPHVNFVNGIKTDLRISDAGLEQAGIYEVFLTEDGCEIRKQFDVQIVVIIQILPVKAEAEVCTGDRISMEAEIVTNLDSLQISWSNDEGCLADDQHFTITNNMNHTALEISNTSLSHSGNYTVQALMPNHQQYNDIFRFKLKVLDVNLKALVKSPVEISSGGNASLKVEKSLEGSLLWKHNEEMLQGLEPHYAFSNADKTELEISDASADQAGMYEVILKVSTCELRKVIEVRISDSKDSKFFGIVDKKYLKVLSGDFTGEWHVAPAVLGGLVLIVLVFISCLCWKGDTKKRKMKEENEREEKSTTSPEKGERPTENKRTVQHVALNDPCYTVENEVIYAALVGTDENYSTIDTSVQLVTSSHPKSFSLGLRSPPVSPLS